MSEADAETVARWDVATDRIYPGGQRAYLGYHFASRGAETLAEAEGALREGSANERDAERLAGEAREARARAEARLDAAPNLTRAMLAKDPENALKLALVQQAKERLEKATNAPPDLSTQDDRTGDKQGDIGQEKRENTSIKTDLAFHD